MSTPYAPSAQFSAFPPATKSLLLANAFVLLITLVEPTRNLLFHHFALWSPFTPVGQMMHDGVITNTFLPWQVVTYGFLHSGIGHFFFNMLALWMFGAPLEQRWGTRRFSIFYLACLVGAAAAQVGVYTLMQEPGLVVGASGAVLGLLAAFGMTFPDTKIYLYFLFPVKAKYFVIFYGLFDLYAGVSGSSSNVAHFAHLGGMVVGVALLLLWRHQARRDGDARRDAWQKDA